jgi:hypothetical protein
MLTRKKKTPFAAGIPAEEKGPFCRRHSFGAFGSFLK